MKGKICDWKDDKGFGFILSESRSGRIFFHISDVKTKERRPKIDDLVNFDVTQDSQQRLKAKNVAIEGLSSVRNNGIKLSRPLTKSVRSIVDYLSIIILLFSLGAGGFTFYQTRDVNKLTPYGVAAIVAIIVLLRQKRPKEKHFTCARCKVVAEFDKRTIQAWNKGMAKLYCSACHQQWLSTQPEQSVQSRGSKSGCLGMFVTLVILSALTFISVYQWLS